MPRWTHQSERSGTPAIMLSPKGLFKAEVIKQLGPRKTMQDLEWETMHWIDWYNQDRLPSSIGYMPPAEAERRYLEQVEARDKVA